MYFSALLMFDTSLDSVVVDGDYKAEEIVPIESSCRVCGFLGGGGDWGIPNTTLHLCVDE